jgi:O-antigen ligase
MPSVTNVEQAARREHVERAPLPVVRRRTTQRPPFPGILAWRPDAVSALTFMIVVTFVLPARLVVKGLGAAGTPANIVGILLFFLWLFGCMSGRAKAARRQPVHFLILFYLAVMMVTYAAGFGRGMFTDESNNATRLVIETFAICGVALVAADAIPNRARLNVLLQRLVYGAAFMAIVGDLEALTRVNLAQRIKVPGLKVNNHLVGLAARGSGNFARVAGTASHYIEFGVVLAMLLPLAIHFAIFAPTRGRRRFNWFLVVLMGLGVPFAVSRSAAVGLAIGMVVVALCWTWRARLNAVIAALIGAVGMKVAKPGLLGTIKSLFSNVSSDPSISGRTTDYGPSFAFIQQRPWFGRGAGSFLPSRYRLLDNQFLLTTIESGFVGLAAFIAMFLGGAALAHRVGKFSPDPETRHLAYALLAVFAVGFLTSFTFDSLSFPIFTVVLFLALGLAGSLWKFDRPARHLARDLAATDHVGIEH